MPKIMFRPNPVPPPFPPPTPPVTTNIIVFSKYPYNVYDVLSVYFKNVEGSQADAVAYEVFLIEEQIWHTIYEFYPQLPDQSNPFVYESEYDSSNVGGYRIECFTDGVSIKIIPLTIQTA